MVESRNGYPADIEQADSPTIGEYQLQPLLRNAIASLKMVAALEKTTPESPLVEMWKWTAKNARADYVRAATALGRSISDIGAKLGSSASDVTSQIDDGAISKRR
jgi:hypothetical protein